MTKSLKKSLLVGTFAGALSLGAMVAGTDEAKAAAYALADVQVTNLLITAPLNNPFQQNVGGNPAFVFTDRTSTSAAGFPGDTSFDSVALTSAYSFADPAACKAAGAGCADADVSYSGPGAAPGENTFAPIGKGGNGGTFGYADSSLYSTAINPGDGGAGGAPGGAFSMIAEASSSQGQSPAGAQAGDAVQQWRFSVDLAVDEVVSVSFNIDGLLRADESDPDALVARATFRFEIALLQDGILVDSDAFTRTVSPDGVNAEIDLSALTQPRVLSVIAENGGIYDFVITAVATAEAQSVRTVPEPGTLGLLGAGLIGLGLAARRRMRVAA